MKTRSQTAPKPLKTVALAPRPSSSPKRRPRPRPKPSGKGSDPRAPKKPPTAFFYFMEDFRKTFQQENPSVKSMQQIGKACGLKWNTMTFEFPPCKHCGQIPNLVPCMICGKPTAKAYKFAYKEEKVKYYDLATEKRAEFEKAMAEYNKKKESCEMSEESDDD